MNGRDLRGRGYVEIAEVFRDSDLFHMYWMSMHGTLECRSRKCPREARCRAWHPIQYLKCQRTNNSICWCFPCSSPSSHAPAIPDVLSVSALVRGPIPRAERYTEIQPSTANFQFSFLTCKNDFNPSVMSIILDNTRKRSAEERF